MQSRQLGTDGPDVSELGLGCLRMMPLSRHERLHETSGALGSMLSPDDLATLDGLFHPKASVGGRYPVALAAAAC